MTLEEHYTLITTTDSNLEFFNSLVNYIDIIKRDHPEIYTSLFSDTDSINEELVNLYTEKDKEIKQIFETYKSKLKTKPIYKLYEYKLDRKIESAIFQSLKDKLDSAHTKRIERYILDDTRSLLFLKDSEIFNDEIKPCIGEHSTITIESNYSKLKSLEEKYKTTYFIDRILFVYFISKVCKNAEGESWLQEYRVYPFWKEICEGGHNTFFDKDLYLEYIKKIKGLIENRINNPIVQEKNKFPFKINAGTQWESVNMVFLNEEKVKINIGRHEHETNYADMGFVDKRNNKPNQQWALLLVFAKNTGQLRASDSGARDKYKKQKELLSNKLKEYFSIDYDPFSTYSGQNGYKLKSTISYEETENNIQDSSEINYFEETLEAL